MDWPTASVAMGSAAASAAVAIWAVRSNASGSKLDRQHDREMAREARQQDRRATAYVELLTALHHLLALVEAIMPIVSANPPAEQPSPLAHPELWRLNALTAAFASREVKEEVRAWTKRQNEFYGAVWYLKQVRDYQQHHTVSDTEASFKVSEPKQWQKVEAFRQDLRDQLEAIGERVNAELEVLT